MKEILSIIRMNKINETKQLLADNGFVVATCRKVYGRGKKAADYSLIEGLIDENVSLPKETMEAISESHRFIAKRLLMLVVQDDEVDQVVSLIIEANQTKSMGDGKIFVLPVEETIRIRTGEKGISAV